MQAGQHHVAVPADGARVVVVLAADDNLVTRRLITVILARHGYKVETFADGAELLERAATAAPSLVILDIMMPAKDGYSTLCALKATAALTHVPVLMLSSNSHGEDVARCLDAGAADYMVKPFSPPELVARVRKLI